MTPNFTLTLSVSSSKEYKTIFTAPHRTQKAANEQFERIAGGMENYGQGLYDPHEYGVFLTIKSARTGKVVRRMQIN